MLARTKRFFITEARSAQRRVYISLFTAFPRVHTVSAMSFCFWSRTVMPRINPASLMGIGPV